ncbi:hypothetical protein [Fictibacillus sp. FJAT-27399]|uniref:hypothetical protein n=1 Tax=Fictibacillus sp. FJAT-27399 TaxID=1729689 RepID=UPI0012E3D43A|nr:hypothetical protein [Fictibacillus sp. FJAT-27399]
MISVPGCSLSAGRALNPSALAPAGFTSHARPAGLGRLRQRYIARRKCEIHFRGVSHLPLRSTCHRRFLNKRSC